MSSTTTEPILTCPKCKREMTKSRLGFHRPFCDSVDTPAVMAKLWLDNEAWGWAQLAGHYGKTSTGAIVNHVRIGLIPEHFADEKALRKEVKRRFSVRNELRDTTKINYHDEHAVRFHHTKNNCPQCKRCTIRANRKLKSVVGPDGLCDACRGDTPEQIALMPDGWYQRRQGEWVKV